MCCPFNAQVGKDRVVGVGQVVFVVLRSCELTMAEPSRRTSTTQSSGTSGSSRSDFGNIAKYYCNCGYEAVMYETDNNYRRRYIVCPLEVKFISLIMNVVIFHPVVVIRNSSALLTCVVHVPPRTTACRTNQPINTLPWWTPTTPNKPES